jgi:uncharacterized delta-60 repeat protein
VSPRPAPRRGAGRAAAALVGAALACGAPAAAVAAAPGTLDPAFGAGGIAHLPVGVGASPGALATDPLGRVLISGRVSVGGTIETLVARLTPGGAVDAGFGSGGLAIAQLGSQPGAAETASAIAGLPGGGVLAAGLASDGRDFVERLLPGGDLDPSFATAGVYLTPYVAGVPPAKLLIRADGRIVLAGTLADPEGETSSLLLVGLTPAGATDPSFGSAGVAGAQVGQRSSHAGATSTATGAALDAAGAVVVAASASDTRGVARGALARFTPAGVLDAGFGSRGVSRLLRLRPAGLVVLGDGRIVVAGQADDATGVPAPALGGFTPSGSIDTGFGVHGLAVTDLFGDFAATGPHLRQGVAIGPALTADGRLVVDAVAAPAQPAPSRVVARFSAAGAIDCSFGAAGRAALPLAGRQSDDAAPVIAPDGDTLVAGDLGSAPGIFVAALAGGAAAAPGSAPVAATGGATRVRKDGVVLDGLVDPRCGRVSASFEYGRGARLTRRTALRGTSARLGPQQVVAVLAHLGHGSYRYRLVIRVGARRIAGATATFRI